MFLIVSKLFSSFSVNIINGNCILIVGCATLSSAEEEKKNAVCISHTQKKKLKKQIHFNAFGQKKKKKS